MIQLQITVTFVHTSVKWRHTVAMTTEEDPPGKQTHWDKLGGNNAQTHVYCMLKAVIYTINI